MNPTDRKVLIDCVRTYLASALELLAGKPDDDAIDYAATDIERAHKAIDAILDAIALAEDK